VAMRFGTIPIRETEKGGGSAFTVAELGEKLPNHFHTIKMIGWELGDWMCTLEGIDNQKVANTEADARATMLIYLLENKLVTL
jgi:hypothetical protein